MQSYVTYEEILHKCELLNDEYEINEEFFHNIIDELLESDQPANKVIMDGFQYLLEQVNKEIGKMEKHMDVTPSCFKGCAFCCYFPIIITELEAKTMKQIIDHWPAERKEKITNHLQQYFQTYQKEVAEVTSLDRENDPDFKKKYIGAQVPCPMLDTETNMCLAYEIRPIPCRTYLNYSDPKVCEQNLMPKETFSYEFLYEFYMGALNEMVQELYENGEELFVDYPSDVWNYDYLANWLKDWIKE